MRKAFGWIFDPYVHVFLIGLLLVRLAMGAGADDPVDKGRPTATDYALESDGPSPPSWGAQERLASKLAGLFHAE
jgi:hypothetical protein